MKLHENEACGSKLLVKDLPYDEGEEVWRRDEMVVGY